MRIALDHVIITVDDLDQSMADFEALGFTVIRGGTHASGTTHNALIAFEDGTYIELLALTGQAADPNSSAADFSDLVRGGEGFAGYALFTDDLDGFVSGLQQRNSAVSGPTNGYRVREDGIEIQWRSAMPDRGMSPFVIQDETARHLRVPSDEALITHANTVIGIDIVICTQDDVNAGIQRYANILNLEPTRTSMGASFHLDNVTVNVSRAFDDIEASAESRLSRIVLKTRKHETRRLDESRSHQAQIFLI